MPGLSTTPANEPPATSLAAGVGPLGPTAERLIEFAVGDAVERFGLSDPRTPIVVVTAEEVTWRDGALGCPSRDMQYAQVLTPGFRIVLEHDGATYAYHAGTGDPFYCARPETPAAG